MADPTNPGQPSDSSTERGTPVNVNEATVKNATVTRMDVATGQIKELQTDLLENLCACIETQTETLSGVIDAANKELTKILVSKAVGGGSNIPPSEKSKNESEKKKNEKGEDVFSQMNTYLKALVAKQTGGGGEGGELGPGSSAAAAKATAEAFDKVSEVINRNTPAIDEWGTLFKEGILIQFKQNMGNLNQSVLDLGRSMTDIGSASRKAWAEAEKMFEISQGGLIDVTAIFDDIGAGWLKGRDALQATVETLVEFREQNVLLIGTLGSNLTEVAETFKRNRQTIEDAFGDDFLGRIPFEEQNVVLTQILGQARRAGVKGEASSILESRATRDQLENLRTIAFMTGKTVEEISKLQEQTSMELDELVFNNLLTRAQADQAKLSEEMLNASGQGGISDFARGIIEAGGIEMAQKNEGFAALAAIPGNMERIQKIMDGYLSGTAAGSDAAVKAAAQLESLGLSAQAMAELRKVMPELKEVGLMQGAAAKRWNEQMAVGSTGGGFQGAERAKEAAKGTVGASIQETYNDVKEFLKNNLGAGGDLALALGFNTAAIIMNTIALGGGSLVKGIGIAAKKVFGKIPGLSKMFGRGGMTLETAKQATARVAKQGAASGGRMAAGRAGLATAGRAGLSALGGAAGVAGAGIAGYQVGKHVVAPLIDAAVESMTGVKDATLGTWLADVFDADSTSEEQKAKTAAEVANLKAAAAARAAAKKGVAPQKGVNPLTPGDSAVVSPSEVTNPESAKAPNQDPIAMELIKHTIHFETMIELITQGNLVRTEMLDVIGLSMNPVPGQHSAPKQRVGASRPPDAYTPLLEDAEW